MKKLRQERHLTQQELADILHTTQQSVQKYEKNRNLPPIPMLISIADYFGTSVDYLIGHTDIPDMIVERQAYELDFFERELIDICRKITPQQREAVKAVAKGYIEIKK